MADQPIKTAGSNQRFAYLDVVRGLAAVAVVITHIFEQGLPGFRKVASESFNLGLLGVLLFFIVSGAVISASIERSATLKIFWLQRFWRLFPAYWVSLAASAALFLLIPSLLDFPVYGHIKDRFWLSLAANTTMVQGFAGYDHFIPAYWTLGFEMLFYVTLSFLFALRIGKHAHLVLWFLSALILFAGIYGLMKGMHIGSFKAILCGYFWLGIWVNRMLRGEVTPKLFWTALVAFQASVAVSWYANFNLHPAAAAEAYAEYPYSPFAMAVAFFGATAVFLCLFQMRHRTFPKFFLLLGTVSYSLYLFHPIAMTLGGSAFNGQTSPLLYTLLTTALTVTLTALAYRLVEVPSLGKVKAVKSAAK